ncbi:ATP-dependent DNA helicase [Trichonephila clavata]|uniref:ATP-dependent DNA helicase n=1 Tax=Trichonephila clavata TaxID=2740835 RepID=A0A8X6KM19_TRICU|nr:ATP-dependent DNA helicase [Trichonephila clavata]
MDILLQYIREIDIGQSSIGDICAAHCVLHDGTNIITVVAYISPNNTVNIIIKFLYKRLMIHGRVASAELGENYHTLLRILAGDFNVNLASEDGQLLSLLFHYKLHIVFTKNSLHSVINEAISLHVLRDLELLAHRTIKNLEKYCPSYEILPDDIVSQTRICMRTTLDL